LVALNNKRNNYIIITTSASEKSVTLDQPPRLNIPRADQWLLFWATEIQCTSYHPNNLTFNSSLSPHLRQGIPRIISSSGPRKSFHMQISINSYKRRAIFTLIVEHVSGGFRKTTNSLVRTYRWSQKYIRDKIFRRSLHTTRVDTFYFTTSLKNDSLP
jgi:hypothetical protein